MCLFRLSQFKSEQQSIFFLPDDWWRIKSEFDRETWLRLHTDPLRPGKLKNTSGPFRCGIWRRTFKSFAECRGYEEKKLFWLRVSVNKKHFNTRYWEPSEKWRNFLTTTSVFISISIKDFSEKIRGIFLLKYFFMLTRIFISIFWWKHRKWVVKRNVWKFEWSWTDSPHRKAGIPSTK